jgi:uncharacterized protein
MQLLKRINLRKRARKRLYRLLLIFCLVVNVVAYLSAHTLTDFNSPAQFGLGLPKPTSSRLPSDIGLKYTTHRIPIDSPVETLRERAEWLETWSIPVANAKSKGTVILFPGNGGSKAKQLLLPAQVFHSLGYNALLVDFRGVGGSSGNTTTLGFREAQDVALSVSYAQKSNFKRPLILYGVSMGTAAILKAIAAEKVSPDAIILELPFARLLDAVRSRIQAISVPTFPLAELIVFWGGIQHGFNGFAHNPVDDASQVKCPILVLHGKLDKWTTGAEIDRIFANLGGSKQLSIFPNAGHNLLITSDREHWIQAIELFLRSVDK